MWLMEGLKRWWARQNVRSPHGFGFVQCLNCGRLPDKHYIASQGSCVCGFRKFTMVKEMSIWNSHLYQTGRLKPILNGMCEGEENGKNLNRYTSLQRM